MRSCRILGCDSKAVQLPAASLSVLGRMPFPYTSSANALYPKDAISSALVERTIQTTLCRLLE